VYNLYIFASRSTSNIISTDSKSTTSNTVIGNISIYNSSNMHHIGNNTNSNGHFYPLVFWCYVFKFCFQSTLLADFHEVRKTAVNMGLFKPNHLFYVLTFLHILAFDLLGWLVMWVYGTGWLPYTVGACLLTVAQV